MTTCLIVTADPILHTELDALVAAAGLTALHAVDEPGVLAAWVDAALVLIGVDRVDLVAALAPGRRERVRVVTRAAAPDSVFRSALAVGASHVVDLRESADWLAEELAGLADPHGRVGRVFGVIGGSGGAGASIFAAALGQSAAREGLEALVVDADPLGAGQDRLLGLDDVPGVRWDALHKTTGRLSSVALRDSVPRRGGVGVLAWPTGEALTLQAFAAREALDAGRRGHDLVVLDLPRRSDAVVAELAARCDALAVVVRPSLSGVAAAAAMLRTIDTRHAGIVVRSLPRSIDEQEIGVALDLPIWTVMGDQRGLDEAVDLGRGPASGTGPLRRAARELLGEGKRSGRLIA